MVVYGIIGVTEDTAYPDLRGIFAINDPSGLGGSSLKSRYEDQVSTRS